MHVYFQQLWSQIDVAVLAFQSLFAAFKQLIVSLGSGDGAVHDLDVVAAKEDGLCIELYVFESVVLDVKKGADESREEGEKFLLGEVLLVPEALRDDLAQRAGWPLEEHVQLVVIGAELLPLQLAHRVHCQHVAVLCDFGDSSLELAVALFHEEGVSEGEDLQQAEALRRPHQRERT